MSYKSTPDYVATMLCLSLRPSLQTFLSISLPRDRCRTTSNAIGDLYGIAFTQHFCKKDLALLDAEAEQERKEDEEEPWKGEGQDVVWINSNDIIKAQEKGDEVGIYMISAHIVL